MRVIAPLAALFTTAFIAVGLVAARQDDDAQDEPKTLLDMTAAERMQLQQKAMELSTPADQHALLAKYVGTFDQEIKMWMGPGTQPMSASGSAVHESVLGGRFLRMTGKSQVLGMNVESIGYWGYDRRSDEFTTVGFDTMGTYFVTGKGPYDEETRSMTLSGTDMDPSLGIEQVYDFVVTLVDDDTFKTEIVFHDMFQPGPFKMMEIVSTRRAPDEK